MKLLSKETALYRKLREEYGETAVFVSLPRDEDIYRLIERIEPNSIKDECLFLSEPLWMLARSFYANKLANRVFALVRRHVYVLEVHNDDPYKNNDAYFKVSSRGDTLDDQDRVLRNITNEEACSTIKTVVDEMELMRVPYDPEPLPDAECDW